jgi:hypothetical protein
MAVRLKIRPVREPAFRRYGRIVRGFDTEELRDALKKTPVPKKGTVYQASEPELEKLGVFAELRDREFGGLPLQIGYCNGVNHKLNALEYHRSSEVNLSADDMVLLLGALQDVDPEDDTYDTSRVEAFLVPAGTMVELYATTLHFAPCSSGDRAFRNAIVLPRGTNLPLQAEPKREGETRLLFAVNKWLIAHPESGMGRDGAFLGLKGENITVEQEAEK